MNFINKMIRKLSQFMNGRNGNDQLNYAITILYIIILFLNVFLRSEIALIIEFALAVCLIFRFLSRNVYARQKENEKFLTVWSEVKKFFLRQKNRFRDRKTHVYRKCPECEAILRLPKVKGSHSVKCPKCSHHFDIKIGSVSKVGVKKK